MRSTIVLSIALGLANCVPPQEPAETRGNYSTSLPDTPGMALLQYVLEQHFAQEGRRVKTTCATILADEGQPRALPEEVETALIERFEDLAPYDRCVWQDGRVVDAVTGDEARIYQVHGIECTAPLDCLAMAGWVAANLGAEYEQYRVRKVAGEWTFEKTGIAIMA